MMARLLGHREGMMKISGLGLFALAGLLASQQTFHRAGKDLSTCCSVIDATIHDHAMLKPGATRGEVEKLFREAGIGATDTKSSYASRYCSCLRLDVTYKPEDAAKHPFSPKDIVVAKSNLYIQVPCILLSTPPPQTEGP